MLCDLYLYAVLKQAKLMRAENRTAVASGWASCLRKNSRRLLGEMEMFCIIMKVHAFVRIVQLRFVYFIVNSEKIKKKLGYA